MKTMKYEDVSVRIPTYGIFAADDAAARKRKELAEKLKRGERVVTKPTGEVVDSKSPEAREGKTLSVPDGKLASGYRHWYERNPDLYQGEKEAMAKFFPNFQLEKLDDGRLCWIGDLAPCGEDDIIWTLMAVYDNNHPTHSGSFGTSIKVYSIVPDLNELAGVERLPHVLTDPQGNLYICTNRKEDRTDGSSVVVTAATTLAWASKWTAAVTCWMHGELDDYTMFKEGGI